MQLPEPVNRFHDFVRLIVRCLKALCPSMGKVEIARRLGVAVHRVEYVVRTRNIQPVSRAGNLRVFSESAADSVARELQRMDADRSRSLL